MFLKPNKRVLMNKGGGSEIPLKSNDNLTVYCSSDTHQKTQSIGKRNTDSLGERRKFFSQGKNLETIFHSLKFNSLNKLRGSENMKTK